MAKAKRKSNGYREYTDNDLKQLSLIQQAQQVCFSLAEIKAFLPSKVTTWNHDALSQTLESKIQEIELLKHKLKVSKQNLRTLLKSINNKPDTFTCEENSERLMNLYYDTSQTP